MVICEVSIEVNREDYTEWLSRKFTFQTVPRIGETIWIGESMAFKIHDVQYGFVDDETPYIRIESHGSDPKYLELKKQFLEDWGFKKT